MAKQVGIIQFNGALGETIGAPSMKGYQVIKKRPVAVTNPNTLKQRKQRTKFAAATATAAAVPVRALAGLRPFSKAVKCSIRNAFSKELLDRKVFDFTGTQTEDLSTTATYAKAVFSRGSVQLPAFGAAQYDTPGVIEVAVRSFPEGMNTALCNIIAVVYVEGNPVGGINPAYIVKSFPCKVNGANITQIEIPVEDMYNGLNAHVWLYVQSMENESDMAALYEATQWNAQSDLSILESKAQYSNTYYGGRGLIG